VMLKDVERVVITQDVAHNNVNATPLCCGS
jgi:hypothetical protein